MFREEKSIDGPVESPGFLSGRFEPELPAIGYCKTLSAKTVTGWFSPLER